jgi:hypothetical protein
MSSLAKSKSTLLNESIETQVIIEPLLQGKRATKKQSKSSITSVDLESYYPDMCNSSHPTV